MRRDWELLYLAALEVRKHAGQGRMRLGVLKKTQSTTCACTVCE